MTNNTDISRGESMSPEIKICAVGGTQNIADEFLHAAQVVLGNAVKGYALIPSQIKDHQMADLFLTMPTRVEELAKFVPKHKIIGFELIPDRKFFVQVALIPAGSIVYIFHNNRRGAETFKKNCEKFGINHVTFEYLPFEEMAETEIQAQLKTARYVIGTNTLLAPNEVLYTRYEKFLTSGARVIAAERVPTLNSAANLMHWITTCQHQILSQTIIGIVHNLTQRLQQITTAANTASSSVDKAVCALEKLHKDITQEVQRSQGILATSKSLAEAAGNIGIIADSIRHISNQTRLLSLNASIEAARVGEQGRGFAVVAKEVGNLANESTKSIETIRKVVMDVQSSVKQIVPAQEEVSSALLVCQGEFKKVVGASVEEQTALHEVFSAMEQIRGLSEELLKATEVLVEARKC